MDGKLVTDLSSKNAEDGGERRPSSFRYSDFFDDQCPFYLNAGMSYGDYWDGENEMCRHYRKAELQKREQKNFEAWHMANYMYHVALSVFPVFNPLVKRKEPFPFMEEPIPITEKAAQEQAERKQKKAMEDIRNKMLNMAENYNKKFKNKVE